MNTVTEGGLIQYAKNAESKYEEEKAKEKTTLDDYSTKIEDVATANWTQDKTTVTNSKITVDVGDYVDYEANVDGYNDTMGWRVLGAEGGNLLLVSASNVVSRLTLSGAEDYNLIETKNGKLNLACEPYKNEEYAQQARSINIDDLNRVTGYNPQKTGNEKIYGEGNINQYNNLVTYNLIKDDSGAVTGVGYESSVITSNSNIKSFRKIGESENITESYKERSTFYAYYPETLTTDKNGNKVGLEIGSKAYDALFNNTSYDEGKGYWLASNCVRNKAGWCEYMTRDMADGLISGSYMWFTDSGNKVGTEGVRAVIVLKTGIKLKPNGTNSWTLSK